MRFFSLFLLLVLSVYLQAQDTTVVLLRHAERASLFDEDSPLSEAGYRRAQALVPLLEAFHPAVLFASNRVRTQQTLAPLAAKLGMQPTIRSKDESAALATEILKAHRGQTVLVCWHHDLMKKLAKGLGVPGPIPYWSFTTYDRFWVVRIPAHGEATLEAQGMALPAQATVLGKPGVTTSLLLANGSPSVGWRVRGSIVSRAERAIRLPSHSPHHP